MLTGGWEDLRGNTGPASALWAPEAPLPSCLYHISLCPFRLPEKSSFSWSQVRECWEWMVRRFGKSIRTIFIQNSLVDCLCAFATIQRASWVPVVLFSFVLILVHLFICLELLASGSPSVGKNEFGNVSFLVLVLESRLMLCLDFRMCVWT